MTEILLDTPPCRVRVLRNKRARRFTLRLDPGGDGAILTVPQTARDRAWRDFLHQHTDWLARALARQPDRVCVTDGAEVPIGGVPHRIELCQGRRRAAVQEEGRLILTGSGAEGPRVAAFLRLRARDLIEPAVRAYARRVGRRVERIALRDTRSRWGSCSTTGTLSFSWRLAMAPDAVLDYVAAHEAAHLAEMNHSPRYWKIVNDLVPGWQAHRDWLKSHGRVLHLYDFSSSDAGRT